MSRIHRHHKGQGIVEYAVIVGAIALVVVGALAATGRGIGDVFRRASDPLVVRTDLPTPAPSPTPSERELSCSAPVYFAQPGVQEVPCDVGETFQEVLEGTIALTVSPPDEHLVTVLAGGGSHVFRGRISGGGGRPIWAQTLWAPANCRPGWMAQKCCA